MKKKVRRSGKKISSPLLIAIILALIIIAGGLTFHFVYQKSNNKSSANNPANPSSNQSNQQVSNSAKQHDLQQEKLPPSSSGSSTSTNQSNLTNVNVFITSASENKGNVNVSGYATTFENGGTCIVTFSSGSTSFDKTSSAIENAQTVVCPTISVPASQFNPKGQWQAVLKYSSSDATGTSKAQSFEVQ